MKTNLSFAVGVGLSLFCASCDEEAGSGSVAFTSWGEEYIEEEIPADVFEDGYAVKYSKFLVLVGDIRVADEAGEVAAQDESFYLVNHVEPGVKDIATFDGLAAGNYTLVSYQTSPAAREAIKLVGSVTAADADLMAQNQYHAYVEGTISKGGVSKTFKWGFSEPTLLDECEGERDGKLTPGAVVTEGGTDAVELTIHGDHFFYDDLQSADAVVRAEAIVNADANMDGVVELSELDAVQLTSLPADQYGTGGASDVNNLGDFVRFLSRTLGHYRGEGECFVKNPE